MAGQGKTFRVRCKTWIEDGAGEAVFGQGRLKVLQTVQELGSLHAAFKASVRSRFRNLPS